MGVEIKFSDKQLPVSPGFVAFLHAQIEGLPAESTWHDQLSEALVPAEFDKRLKHAESVAEGVLQHPLGQKAIYRAYQLFTAMLLGETEKLDSFRSRYRFICVVGCPRHGGSYITKHLFKGLGIDPDSVPNMLAHDGFPDAAPFLLAERHNGYTAMMQQTAEYLAMVETFFGDRSSGEARIVVPKKATKAAYHGAFFASVLGPDADYIFTLRHPVAACISTYEKSGGLPADGRFAVRSNIEEWAQRDALALGIERDRLTASDYFDIYLRYWEQYHLNLALTGLSGVMHRTIVAYGRERLMDCARHYQERLGGNSEVEGFTVFDKRERHRDWHRRAEPVIRRVAQVWGLVGLGFPLEQIMEGW